MRRKLEVAAQFVASSLSSTALVVIAVSSSIPKTSTWHNKLPKAPQREAFCMREKKVFAIRNMKNKEELNFNAKNKKEEPPQL